MASDFIFHTNCLHIYLGEKCTHVHFEAKQGKLHLAMIDGNKLSPFLVHQYSTGHALADDPLHWKLFRWWPDTEHDAE